MLTSMYVCSTHVCAYVHTYIHTYIRTYVHRRFVMLRCAVLLTSACIPQRYVCIRLLISPPCLKDNEGRLPLHWATNNRSPQCIKLMLDKVRVDKESLRASVDKMICTYLTHVHIHTLDSGKLQHIGESPLCTDVHTHCMFAGGTRVAKCGHNL